MSTCLRRFRRQSNRFEGQQGSAAAGATSSANGRASTARRMNGKAGPAAGRSSPFASSDSLADTNGIWNESQATVRRAVLSHGQTTKPGRVLHSVFTSTPC